MIHYKKALTAKSEYPVALNNLGFAYQRLLKEDEAYKNYQEVLKLDPKNKTAISQIKRLERIIGKDKDQLLNKKGFWIKLNSSYFTNAKNKSISQNRK